MSTDRINKRFVRYLNSLSSDSMRDRENGGRGWMGVIGLHEGLAVVYLTQTERG